MELLDNIQDFGIQVENPILQTHKLKNKKGSVTHCSAKTDVCLNLTTHLPCIIILYYYYEDNPTYSTIKTILYL